MSHFEQAQGEIDLSTRRQVFTEIPHVTWADVGGLNSVRELLREVVELPLPTVARLLSSSRWLTNRPAWTSKIAQFGVDANTRVRFLLFLRFDGSPKETPPKRGFCSNGSGQERLHHAAHSTHATHVRHRAVTAVFLRRFGHHRFGG